MSKEPLLTILCVTTGWRKGRSGLLSCGKLKSNLIDLGLSTEYIIAVDANDKKLSAESRFARDETLMMANSPQTWNNDAVMIPESDGIVEDVLDKILKTGITTDWVLRIDDDEEVSPTMVKLLPTLVKANKNNRGLMYKFPRGNVWIAGGATSNLYILRSPPLWPDYQVRLFHRDYFSWPKDVHGGHEAAGKARLGRAIIWHYKFIMKSYEERKAQAKIYERKKKGAGFGRTYLPFTLPEDHYIRGCKAVLVPPGSDISLDQPEEWETNAPTIKISKRPVLRTELLEF